MLWNWSLVPEYKVDRNNTVFCLVLKLAELDRTGPEGLVNLVSQSYDLVNFCVTFVNF